MKKFLLSIFLSLAAGSLWPLAAQVFTNPIPPQINVQNQIWRNFRMGQIGNQMAADMARGSKTKGKSAETAAAKSTAGNTRVYRRQFAFQRSANSPLAEKMAGTQIANAGSLEKSRQIVNYMWGKYQTSFADENRRLGMPFNDVVTAMTYYIEMSYIYANDLRSVRSENTVEVYKQIAELMGKDTEFSKISPADKELFAELLITMGGMPGALYDQHQNKNEMMAAGRANLERIFGVQAQNLKITAGGIEF